MSSTILNALGGEEFLDSFDPIESIEKLSKDAICIYFKEPENSIDKILIVPLEDNEGFKITYYQVTLEDGQIDTHQVYRVADSLADLRNDIEEETQLEFPEALEDQEGDIAQAVMARLKMNL